MCAKCKEKIVYVPAQGWGNVGAYQHLEPPPIGVADHIAHPSLHVY